MQRILEPEIMDGEEQALAYAQADFSRENQSFVEHFLALTPAMTTGHVLDLGCGPADIPIRLIRRRPDLCVTGVEASPPMVRLAKQAIEAAGLSDRISLVCQRFQDYTPPEPFDAIISNSLVHHVPNPLQFWYAVKRCAKPGAPVLVMDLVRPDSPEEAHAIVDRYAASESGQLRQDFYRSLLSAFTPDEIAAQLAELNLTRLLVDVIDDRHWLVMGSV
ncbi:MAG: class I SAM-dependent methyltransferase [Nitrospirae bacterium]|nr:MAG: class I SAM-dependent methyltransferase [Nitrospirota bacterium]